MRPYIKLIIIYLTLIISGCNYLEETSQSLDDYLIAQDTIDIGSSLGIVMSDSTYFDIIKVKEIIKLETTRNSLIRNISKLGYSKDLIFVLDDEGKQFMKFSKTGKYLDKYSINGVSGRGKVQSLDEFILMDDEIALYSNESNKLIFIDYNLSPLREVSLNNKFDCGVNLGKNENLIYLGQIEQADKSISQVVFVDSTFSVKKSYFPRSGTTNWYLTSIDYNGNLQKSDSMEGGAYLFPHFDPSIYYLGKSKPPIKLFHLKFGNNPFLTFEKIQNLQKDRKADITSVLNTPYVHSTAFAVLPNHLVLTFTLNKQIYHFFYSTKKKFGRIVAARPDPICGCGTIIRYKGIINNKLALITDPAFNPYLDKYLEFTNKQKKIIDNILVSDNPYIILSDLK